jgi:hypothetical protein
MLGAEGLLIEEMKPQDANYDDTNCRSGASGKHYAILEGLGSNIIMILK